MLFVGLETVVSDQVYGVSSKYLEVIFMERNNWKVPYLESALDDEQIEQKWKMCAWGLT